MSFLSAKFDPKKVPSFVKQQVKNFNSGFFKRPLSIKHFLLKNPTTKTFTVLADERDIRRIETTALATYLELY